MPDSATKRVLRAEHHADNVVVLWGAIIRECCCHDWRDVRLVGLHAARVIKQRLHQTLEAVVVAVPNAQAVRRVLRTPLRSLRRLFALLSLLLSELGLLLRGPLSLLGFASQPPAALEIAATITAIRTNVPMIGFSMAVAAS